MSAADLIFDQDGYPTEATLEAIRTWEPPFEPLFDRLGELWRWPTYFRRSTHRRRRPVTLARTYHVSTGGWSGHESVIDAMQDNLILWTLCWWSSRRGGHYVFKVLK